MPPLKAQNNYVLKIWGARLRLCWDGLSVSTCNAKLCSTRYDALSISPACDRLKSILCGHTNQYSLAFVLVVSYHFTETVYVLTHEAIKRIQKWNVRSS